MNELSQASVKAIALALTVIVVASLGAAGYLYYQNNVAQQQQRQLLTLILYHDLTHVTVIIDYGNGTKESHTVTFTPGITALQALEEVALVNKTYWQAYDSYFIDAINGVWNNENNNGYWWIYNVKHYFSSEVEHPSVGANKYQLSGGDTVIFVYQFYG
ncbi:MAG: DUF4430 domain-containing protein [Candidatus Jordarchaeales archaeon]